MQDRVSLYPGRVKLTPVAGQENTFDMVRADQPTQEGTPLNKATLLKDVTASILGLPNTAVPDDAFLALTIGVGTYGFRVKIQLADGTPVEGARVSGITALTGSTLVSGTDGIVLGKSTSKTVTISCTSPYIDQAAPASQSVTATGTITDVTLILTAITDMITVTSGKTAKVSPIVKTMDVTAVGGGGGGGGGCYGGYDESAAGGGGGGYVFTKTGVASVAKAILKITVGSAGSGGASKKNASSPGTSGGTTSVTLNDATLVTANGGAGGENGYGKSYPSLIPGGIGNGNGGTGTSKSGVNCNGGAGSGYIFNDSSLGLAGGGGGGGGTSGAVANGGSPNGGNGSHYDEGYSSIIGGTPGENFGGGGGGGHNSFDGCNGGRGGVYLRFHF